ncbi:hypothetical protein Tco_0650263, partial [Tanacetum coccineum]
TKSGQVPVNAAKQSSPKAAALISSVRPVNTADPKSKVNDALPKTYSYFKEHLPDQGIFDSGCSRHMTGNKSFLTDYQEIDGGFVALDVLFTETECLVLSPDFKLLDESQVLLNVPRQNNMYSFDLKNVIPSGDDEFVDDAGKKNDAQYPAKDSDKNGHEKDVRDQEEALRKQLDQETKRLYSTGNLRGAYDDEDVGAEADLNNLESTMNVSPILTTRIHKDHPKDQIIRDINSAIQTRRFDQFFLRKCYGDPSFDRFKLDRINARGASTILTSEGLDTGLIYLMARGPLEPNGIEAIRLFFAYALYMGFIVYQMDVKSAFLYGIIEEEDCKYNRRRMVKDEEAGDVDVHLYRSMIGSLMYLTASRPDIMFAVCACARIFTSGGCSILARGGFHGNVKMQAIVAFYSRKQSMLLLLIAVDRTFKIATHQIVTPPIASHEPQTEANIEKILPSPSIYQRKHRKTQKHKRATKVTELAKNSVPLDLGVDKAVHKKGGSERVHKQPNESPFLEGHTFGSGEGRMEHTFELMDIVPLTPHDLHLRRGYSPGSDEVKSSDDDLDEEDATKQGRTSDKTKPMFKNSDFDDLVDEGMAFVQEKDAKNQVNISANDTEVVNTAGKGVSTAASRTPLTTTTVFDDKDVTMAMAQTLINMKEES